MRHYGVLMLTAFLLLVSTEVRSSDIGPSDLTGEDQEMFARFRELFQNGSPDAFYYFTEKYEKDLKEKGYMMLYYKLLNNEGFFALRHNMIFRAMQTAERLNKELHADGARRFYYLSTGLSADIYHACHNRKKAEAYFIQALEEVGDSDPKFTMRSYQSLAEILCLSYPDKAIEWLDKSVALAVENENVEYHSLSLAMMAYIHFLNGHSEEFFRYYGDYKNLEGQDKPGFSNRYGNVLETARLAFHGDYQEASNLLANSGTVYVDSSLVAVRIFAMQGDLENGFGALKRRYLEMDSIYSVAQEADFDQIATEHALVKSQEEAMENKKLVRRLYNCLAVLVIAFLIIYIMGRRRLWLKIQERNRELKAALSKAEESDRMKTVFIRSMSHEIRTPLNAVAGFSQLLCSPDYKLDATEKGDIQQRIMENVSLITSIVNEVLELSKSESEGEAPTIERTDVCCNDLGRSVLQNAKGKQNTGVDLRFISDVDDDYKILTNNYRVKSALSHLMDNAIKFTEKGYVELSCRLNGDRMCFVVTDTGIGIREEDRERIFETFLKVDDFKAGIGLGLPICRRLIRSLGGEVELDTSYTEGSRFVISVPIK